MPKVTHLVDIRIYRLTSKRLAELKQQNDSNLELGKGSWLAFFRIVNGRGEERSFFVKISRIGSHRRPEAVLWKKGKRRRETEQLQVCLENRVEGDDSEET